MPQIDEILRLYPMNAGPARIEPLGSAGGMSGAQFWLIATHRGTLVLRRWPTEHPTPERLRFIHAVLDHAVRHGVAVIPLPIRTTAGETFAMHAGHLWELAPWMPGEADSENATSNTKLRAAMIALAQFHVAVADFSRSSAPAGTRQPASPGAGSAGGLNAVKRHHERLCNLTPSRGAELSRSICDADWPELAPLARQFLAELPRALPQAISQLEPLLAAPLPVQPCIRDIWHDHVLFTGDEVTGIIDFGAVDFDTPATDIARLLGSLAPLPFREGPGEGSKRIAQIWRDGLAAYSTNRPLSAIEEAAARALDASGSILAGCNWIRWIYVDGRQFDNQQQVIERFRRIVRRILRDHG